MSASRWPEIERVCQAALERPAESRRAFIAEACGNDDVLRREVESLLAQSSGADSFIETPALEMDVSGTPAGPGLTIGQRVGQYQVVAWLGAGGMGEVYRAHDAELRRDVALKVLPSTLVADPERLARFEREARVLAALNHRNVGAIFGLAHQDGVRALVLELVDGETLAHKLEHSGRGALTVNESLAIAGQIADALETAHEKGIVHRDLKPANIKITPAGVVKVLDFGLAKAASSDGIPDLSQSPKITVGGTHEGVLLGTAAYMSPEQARGQRVDKRTDIWAFGCVLYEMITGRPVFSGSTVSDTLAAVLEREPDWTPLSNAMPAAIHRLLRRCLEKNSNLRLHDIADARIEIDEALLPSPTGQPTTHGWPKQWAAAAAVMLVVGLGLGAWAVSRFRQPDTDGPVLRLQITPPDGGQFGVIGLTQRGPSLALSPDGRTAVYGATVNGHYALWLRSLDDTVARVLRGTEDAGFPFWSPDGRSIAFFASGKLQRVDVAGGPPIVICDVPGVYGGAWAGDGRILVGIFGGSLASVPASGGTLSAFTTLDRSKGDVVHAWPQVLPGGHFLYWGGSTKPEDNGVIYAASFEKPNERVRLTTTETSAIYTSRPDGQGYLLWQHGGTLIAQEFDGTTFKFAGEPRPIADAIGMVGAAAFIAVAASSNGSLLYANASLQRLTWFGRVGKELGTLGDPGQFGPFLRFSPDGKQIATTRVEAGRELVLMEVDRAMSRRGTFDSRGGFFPQWSPDGRTILFIGDNATALYRKDATGATPDHRLAPWPVEDMWLTDWSRDGRSLLNMRNTVETGADIWVVPVTPDGHLAADAQPKPYLRTPVNEGEGRFSPEPNPRWVAYSSDESGHLEVYVQSFPEPRGPHRISTNGGTAPQWGPSGRELFYLAPNGKVMAVSVKLGSDTIEASEPRALFTIPRESFFEVAPDGQRFLVNLPDPTPHPLNVIVNWPSLLKQSARQ